MVYAAVRIRHEKRAGASKARAASASTTRRCSNSPATRIKIEDHYSSVAGHPMPMDIEWAKDADDGQLYIIQARPETVASRKTPTAFETYSLARASRHPCCHRSRGRREDRDRAACASLPARDGSRHSSRARCWWPIDQPGLGAGHEDRRRDRDRATAGAPVTPRLWPASSAFPPWSAPRARKRH